MLLYFVFVSFQCGRESSSATTSFHLVDSHFFWEYLVFVLVLFHLLSIIFLVFVGEFVMICNLTSNLKKNYLLTCLWRETHEESSFRWMVLNFTFICPMNNGRMTSANNLRHMFNEEYIRYSFVCVCVYKTCTQTLHDKQRVPPSFCLTNPSTAWSIVENTCGKCHTAGLNQEPCDWGAKFLPHSYICVCVGRVWRHEDKRFVFYGLNFT